MNWSNDFLAAAVSHPLLLGKIKSKLIQMDFCRAAQKAQQLNTQCMIMKIC
jgi:hypothetical protein